MERRIVNPWTFADSDGNQLMLHHRYAPYADGPST
jgi:hypothetical protein